MEVGPGTSGHKDLMESSDKMRRETKEDPFVPFVCYICGLNTKCHYGRVEVAGRTHSYEYSEEVYYMMDPFRNRAKVDKRRLASEEESRKSEGKSNIPNILDFLVVGALCFVCGQPVCVDELCSVFYARTFCSTCVMREKAQFPSEIIQQLEASRAARKRREADEIKPPAVEETE